jgi:hypothetical protein
LSVTVLSFGPVPSLEKFADSLFLPLTLGLLVAVLLSFFPKIKSRPAWQRIVAFVVLLLVATALIYLATPHREQDFTIAGTVRDESTGIGVAGVELKIYGRTEKCVSDDTGNFRMRVTPKLTDESQITITADKTGYDKLSLNIVPPQHDLQLMLRKTPR